MPKVKVWNDNVHPHKEMFKDNLVEIPAKSCIEMEWEEAIEFKGQFTPIRIRGDGTHDPAGFKMIRVEAPTTPIFKENDLVNHATGKVAATKEELQAMLEKFSHLRVVDEDAEAQASTKDATIADLQRQVAELAALVKQNLEGAPAGKRKPGPKPKQAAAG